jgi:hypothetical protein
MEGTHALGSFLKRQRGLTKGKISGGRNIGLKRSMRQCADDLGIRGNSGTIWKEFRNSGNLPKSMMH